MTGLDGAEPGIGNAVSRDAHLWLAVQWWYSAVLQGVRSATEFSTQASLESVLEE
jgi:hypothetical protein